MNPLIEIFVAYAMTNHDARPDEARRWAEMRYELQFKHLVEQQWQPSR